MESARPPDVLAIARNLAAQAGLAAPERAQALAGGRNNRVFRLEADSAPALVLKLYHADPRDPRDRLAHEWSFLSHARAQGVLTTPDPLAHDIAANAGLYSFAPGRKLVAGEVGPRHLDAALDFIISLNASPGAAAHLPEGSEACFSLAEHVAAVERRIERLANLDADAPLRADVEAFVGKALRPSWAQLRAGVERGAKGLGVALGAAIDEAAIIASPSDFGFHNALVDDRGVTFIDFEYAGRDDPAKLACDFFCCPEAPPPLAEFGRFVDSLMSGLDAARARLLLDAYRVKWACIVLNDFLPLGAARRAFASHVRTTDHCAAQLARAQGLLDQIGTDN